MSILSKRLPILFLTVFSSAVYAQVAPLRPNFVLILADDQGYQDLGCFGSPDIRTPRIDALAREGMRFTSFYAQPLCGPSRTALLTGCYPIRVGEYGNEKRNFPYVHEKELLLPRILQEAGYATGMIGKVDITARMRGWKPELNPVRRGFDFWYGCVGANDSGQPMTMYRNESRLEPPLAKEEITQAYTREAVGFIRRHQDRPFLLYVAHTMPHYQIGASAPFRGKSPRGLYGDVIAELDWSTGQIIDTLRELGLDDHTLVVYTSDNGPYFLREAVETGQAGSARPLRGSKGTTWEGGMRVPCVMWAPGFIPAGSATDEVASLMDLFPTFIAHAGGALPKDIVVDGRDLSPILTGQNGAKSPHEALYYYMEAELEAVRSGKWKLVLPRAHVKDRPWLSRSQSYGKFVEGVFDGVGELQLYDLEADIGESRNVADAHPEVVRELKRHIEKAYVELGNYDRIGSGVRFHEEGPKWPNLEEWRRGKLDAADVNPVYLRGATPAMSPSPASAITRTP